MLSAGDQYLAALLDAFVGQKVAIKYHGKFAHFE
jgi:hypothetical protein